LRTLVQFVAAELDRSVLPEIVQAAHTIAERLGGGAVLFYGSVLRTADLSGVLDFYVLQPPGKPAGFLSRHIWPDVSYHEVQIGRSVIRAKVAAMQIDTFERAARGMSLDTTIWARFVQPAALIWAESPALRRRIQNAVADAARTAGWFAALHGAVPASPGAYWRGLFRATYTTELRVEAPGREGQILSYDPARYDELLPLAWEAGGIAYEQRGDTLLPKPSEMQLRTIAAAWMQCAQAGKWLNLIRLVKAAFTFDGATRYALWKIERHTGLNISVTPFRERHPIIAAPGVLWRLWQHSH
jgi:hypothetical protein